MHRIDGAGAALALPTPSPVGTPGYFDTATKTAITDDWLNAVQEEIANVIEGEGGTLSKTDRTQLYAAIQSIAAATPYTLLVGNGLTGTGKYSTLAEAVAAAGTLIAGGSTYAVRIRVVGPTVETAVPIYIPCDGIIIEGGALHDSKDISWGHATSSLIGLADKNNVVIRDLKITYTGTGTPPAFLNGGDGVLLENVHLTSTGAGVAELLASGPDSIRISGCSGGSVTAGNRVIIDACDLVDLDVGEEAKISGCNFSGDVAFGGRMSNCVIAGNLSPWIGSQTVNNRIDGDVSLYSETVFAGNKVGGSVEIGAATPGGVINGNMIAGDVTFGVGTNADGYVFTGNVVGGALGDAGSLGTAIVMGNRAASVFGVAGLASGPKVVETAVAGTPYNVTEP